MATLASFLLLHVLLLCLAATHFTIVTGITNGHFQWEYFRYSSHSGWGGAYQPAGTLSVVLLYLSAYGIGLIAYGCACRGGQLLMGLIGIVLCGIGFASYVLELSHWFFDHQRSWIASAPIVLPALALLTVVQKHWRTRGQSMSSHGKPKAVGVAVTASKEKSPGGQAHWRS